VVTAALGHRIEALIALFPLSPSLSAAPLSSRWVVLDIWTASADALVLLHAQPLQWNAKPSEERILRQRRRQVPGQSQGFDADCLTPEGSDMRRSDAFRVLERAWSNFKWREWKHRQAIELIPDEVTPSAPPILSRRRCPERVSVCLVRVQPQLDASCAKQHIAGISSRVYL
jgi:hypothetical protein